MPIATNPIEYGFQGSQLWNTYMPSWMAKLTRQPTRFLSFLLPQLQNDNWEMKPGYEQYRNVWTPKNEEGIAYYSNDKIEWTLHGTEDKPIPVGSSAVAAGPPDKNYNANEFANAWFQFTKFSRHIQLEYADWVSMTGTTAGEKKLANRINDMVMERANNWLNDLERMIVGGTQTQTQGTVGSLADIISSSTIYGIDRSQPQNAGFAGIRKTGAVTLDLFDHIEMDQNEVRDRGGSADIILAGPTIANRLNELTFNKETYNQPPVGVFSHLNYPHKAFNGSLIMRSPYVPAGRYMILSSEVLCPRLSPGLISVKDWAPDPTTEAMVSTQLVGAASFTCKHPGRLLLRDQVNV